MIKKRQRQELYDKFRQGAIPSGADFADLIKSQLNLLDDGIDISEDSNNPVCLKARGAAENILDFANQDGLKRWRIAGRSEAASTEGLNLQADERSKVYIERETGNVGINTDQPAAKLHIIQTGADDVLRIDDVGNDETPFVITSDGQVGIGTGLGAERPKAKLHISYDGVGDVLRVDDNSEDRTPFIINEQGRVGIGCSRPNTNLTIVGGVSICSEDFIDSIESKPAGNSLYVEDDIIVGGTVVFSGGQSAGGIKFNAPLTSSTEELVIKDNLKITGDTTQDGSRGDLTVAGNTFLGTYNAVMENQNVVTINGRIESGGVSEHGIEQYELEINRVLKIDRTPNKQKLSFQGNTEITGSLSTTKEITIAGITAANVDIVPPVGTVIAWLPGLYQNNNQTGFKVTNIPLSPNWRVCNGIQLSDNDNSPLGTGYLPNLTDNRFLMGVTDYGLGSQGGTNDGTNHTHGFINPYVPGHYHSKGNLALSGGNHYHDWPHGTERDDSRTGGSYNEFTLIPGTVANLLSGGAHDHTVSGNVGNLGGQNGDQNITTVSGSVNGVSESLTNTNLPKYLSVKYIMRVK